MADDRFTAPGDEDVGIFEGPLFCLPCLSTTPVKARFIMFCHYKLRMGSLKLLVMLTVESVPTVTATTPPSP